MKQSKSLQLEGGTSYGYEPDKKVSNPDLITLFELIGITPQNIDIKESQKLNQALAAKAAYDKLTQTDHFFASLWKNKQEAPSKEKISRLHSLVAKEEAKLYAVNTEDKVRHNLAIFQDLLYYFKMDPQLNTVLRELAKIKQPKKTYKTFSPLKINRILFDGNRAKLVGLNKPKRHHNGITGISQSIFPREIETDPQSKLGKRTMDPLFSMTPIEFGQYDTIPGLFYPSEKSIAVTREIKKLLTLYTIATDFSVPLTFNFNMRAYRNLKPTIGHLGRQISQNLDQFGRQRPLILTHRTMHQTKHTILNQQFAGSALGIYKIGISGTSYIHDGYKAESFEQLLDESKELLTRHFNVNYQNFRKQLLITIQAVYQETVRQMTKRQEFVDKQQILSIIAVSYLPWLNFILERYVNSVLNLGETK